MHKNVDCEYGSGFKVILKLLNDDTASKGRNHANLTGGFSYLIWYTTYITEQSSTPAGEA